MDDQIRAMMAEEDASFLAYINQPLKENVMLDHVKFEDAPDAPVKVTKKYRPLGDRVLVLIDPVETRSKGGILLPDQAQKKLNRGTVLALGDAVPRGTREGSVVEEPIVKPGDKVLYTPYAGTDVPGCKDLIVVKTEDIVVVEEGALQESALELCPEQQGE